LTGLKNRRVFDEHLDQLWARAVDDGRAIAILMIDIDHFKAYNDRYGHQAGDQALRRVAQALQPFVTRPLDVLARYGGEEFAVICREIDGEGARALGERLRKAVEDHKFEHAGKVIPVTVSVGTVAGRKIEDAHAFVAAADAAMYEAKREGRNRVHQAPEPSTKKEARGGG
jgi:diguanylate cyclase (GGDEF)-like protein